MLVFGFGGLCASEEVQRSFDLPRGKAIETLRIAALQGEIQILFSDSVVNGVMTKAVRGVYSPRKALELMLEGTELGIAQANTNGAYAITFANSGSGFSESNDITPTTKSYPKNKTETEMNPKNNSWLKSIAAALTLGVAAGQGNLVAQTNSEEEVFNLSPFEVSSEGDRQYLAANSISGSRVNLPLERIPTRISVVTEDLFRDVKEFNVDEAVKYVGVRKRGFFGNSFNIRGFSAFTQIDNMGQDSVAAWDNIIVERVDVAKGPSGVLYGVGSPGGAVNIITKKPYHDPGWDRLFVRGSSGSRGAFRMETDMGGQMDEEGKIAWRFSGAIDRFVPGIAFGEQLKIAIMPQISFQFTEKTKLHFQYVFQQIPDMVPWNERFPQLNGVVTLPGGVTRTTAIGFVPGVPEDFNADGPDSDRFDQNDMFTATLIHQLNDSTNIKLTYRNTKREQERRNRFLAVRPQLLDGVLTPNPVPVQIWRSFNDTDRNTLQADVNYTWSVGESVHGNLVVGGSYDWNDNSNVIFWNRDTAWLTDNGFVLDILDPPTDKSDPRHAEQYKIGDFPNDFVGPVWQDSLSDGASASPWVIFNSFFAEDRVNVMGGWRRDYRIRGRTDSFSRYDTDRQNITFANEQDLDTFMGGVSVTVASWENAKGGKDSLTAFANMSQAKNFNGFPFEATPRLGEGIEFGVKASLFGGKVYSTLSYFDLEQSNIPRRDPNFGGDLTLGGLETSTGLDLDVYWFPVEGTTIFFNIIDQDPKVASRTDLPFVEGSITGDGGYKEAWQLAATQRFSDGPLEGISMTFGAIHRGEEKPFGDNPGLFLLTQPSYTTYNASISKQFELQNGRTMTIEAFAKNLTDEFYIESNMIIGRAREFWGAISYEF